MNTSDNVSIPVADEYLPAILTKNDERAKLQAMIGPAMAIAHEAESFEVINISSYEKAAQRRAICRTASDEADKFRRSFTDPLNNTIKRWNAFFKAPTDYLQDGARVYEGKLLAFDRAQREAEEKARQKAEIDAANEKARLQREAERTAKALEKKGEAEAAADVRNSVPDVPVVPALLAAKRPEGVSIAVLHRAQCVDLPLLCKAIAEGKAPVTLVKADESALNKFAGATKGSIEIAGVRFYKEESMRQRT